MRAPRMHAAGDSRHPADDVGFIVLGYRVRMMRKNKVEDPDVEVPTVPSIEMDTDDPRNVTNDDEPAAPETGEPRGGIDTDGYSLSCS
jgi:hypothetical protein